MLDKQKIIRQKTLFDDENSDENFLKEELKRRRQLEIKRKEKESIEKYNKWYVENKDNLLKKGGI